MLEEEEARQRGGQPSKYEGMSVAKLSTIFKET
jgi:hypothetical protein